MNFRLFTSDGKKIAVAVDRILYVKPDVIDPAKHTIIALASKPASFLFVDEDFDTVFSRLNTIFK